MGTKKTNKEGQSLFDSLISELISADPGKSLLDICLSGNQKAIRSVPLRFRLIALGFVKGLSLEEVNSRLVENGCDRLYARSLSEATLIYAFSNGLKYNEWKLINTESLALRDRLSADTYMAKGSISLADVREFVNNNSVYEDDLALTLHRTQMLQDDLSSAKPGSRQLSDFLLSNISSFCNYREKSRYYFCKYLMYYLESRRDAYLRVLPDAFSDPAALDELSVFKSITSLRRKKHTKEEAAELLEDAGISFGEVYQNFQDFYFEYTSQDWMDIMLDRYGDIASLSEKQKKALAALIRKYYPKKADLSDEELIRWQQDETERREADLDSDRSYQKDRAGENFLRKVVRGELDLDRTTLMAFMLFFDSTSEVPEEHRVDEDRLNEILSESGFSELDPESLIDDFFTDYMQADDPITFLIEEAEIMAMSEENFYLYKTYLGSRNTESELAKITNVRS